MDMYENENFLLTERLRIEDPEQFYTLVRMHLSFVLDLNTDECDGNSEKKPKANKWNLPFTKKPKIGSKSTVEGNFLTLEFIAQMHPVIEFLSKEENISQEGIFRRSGKVTRQQELKSLLHQGVPIDFNDGQFSVHDCASVLKNILSELPESILTDAHYPAYCQIAELCQGKSSNYEERLLRSLQLLILLLPMENRKFFQDLIELLHLAVNFEEKNRMSAYNLATLFTPHLLCPRRLSPEALHLNSQTMSHVVAFMIQKGSVLFKIPSTLATDVRAYWSKKERKKLSPLKQMNESIYDGTAASTVFTFVDRERTALENRTNPTETALAQLYAYIQSLPESSKKRKLIKQFNKENGYGTPLRASAGKKRAKTLNLGGSIKKHLSGFSKTTKRNIQYENVVNEEEITSLGETEVLSVEKFTKNEYRKTERKNIYSIDQSQLEKNSVILCQKEVKQHNISESQIIYLDNDTTSSVKKTFGNSDMNKSDENLNNCLKFDNEEQKSFNSNESVFRGLVSLEEKIQQTPKRNLSPTNIETSCKTSRYLSSCLVTKEHQNWPSSLIMATSTPAPGNSCLLTPIVDKNNSMSPITKSTKRMPKFMQETMMTPRSRKPVISLSGTDLWNLASTDSMGNKSSHSPKSVLKNSLESKLIIDISNEETPNDSLSSTFRNYLFSRSLLTASPVDLSFSSRTDDFLSFSENNSSELENFKSLPEILNEGGLSESLLYCLNGNDPDCNPDLKDNKARLKEPYSFLSDKHENDNEVYETAL